MNNSLIEESNDVETVLLARSQEIQIAVKLLLKDCLSQASAYTANILLQPIVLEKLLKRHTLLGIVHQHL